MSRSPAKGIISFVVIAALIGYKVYNRTPHYREEISERIDLAANEIAQYSFEPSETVKAKLEVQANQPGEVLVFVLDDPNLKKFDAALATDDMDFKGVDFAMRSMDPTTNFVQEADLSVKTYNVLIVNMDEEKPTNVTLKLSSYQ